ncbi:LYR motif-containing protein 4 isoform 1-T1 [Sylvia borin]
MAASSRAQVLQLYRALLRESQRFSGYNYRTYAIRRIRDAFRENKNVADSAKIEELLKKAKANLEVIQRQHTSETLNSYEHNYGKSGKWHFSVLYCTTFKLCTVVLQIKCKIDVGEKCNIIILKSHLPAFLFVHGTFRAWCGGHEPMCSGARSWLRTKSVFPECI